MATKSIKYFKNGMRFDRTKTIREVARNKERMYAVNAVKAARQILRRRR